MRFGTVYNLIVLVLIFHYDFIYCAQKTSEAAVASALPLALPRQRLQTVASSSTAALVLRPQAAPQQRSGVLSPDPRSHDDQRTMKVQVVLQAQSSGRPAVWVLRRAMASMLGQDVRARWQRVFERQPERPVELHRLAGHGTRSTNSAEAKISACEKCRQNKVTSWPQGTTQRRVSCTCTGPSLELQAVGQRAIYHAYLFQCASRESSTESGDRAQEARDSHHTRGHRAAHRRDDHTSDHLQECALRCLKGEPSACQIADCATGTTEAPRAMVFLPGAEHCEMERFRGGLQQQGPGLGGKGDLKELHSKQDKAVLESATEVISDGEDDGMKIETAGVIKQGIDSVVTNLENIRVRPAEASKEESAAAKKARIGDSGKASAALQPFARPGNSDLKEICPRPIHNLCFQDHFDLIWKVFTCAGVMGRYESKADGIAFAEFACHAQNPSRLTSDCKPPCGKVYRTV
mmetsp:Transcript_44264/g.96321  ORF Transcript_44264/g.96321 Transcript_44264/m.96321 type:complete len:463 (+) Transcript_44264:197-1585(+)